MGRKVAKRFAIYTQPCLEKTRNEASGSDIVSIGDTAIAPLGIYSSKIENLEKLEEGAKVTIPDAPSNGARALFLLQSAGLIEVEGKEGDAITPADIKANPKNLEIIELSAAQTARALMIQI